MVKFSVYLNRHVFVMLSPCQSLFSGKKKNEKNVVSLSSAVYAHSVVNVNEFYEHFYL